MPTTNAAATLPQLQARLGIGDSQDDAMLEASLTAITREIEQYTRHVYYATTATRVYTPTHASWLLLPPGHDLLSVTALKTDEDDDRVYEATWATTDYDLEPANNGVDGLPYWAVCTRTSGQYAFPAGIARGVSITGSWGFSTTAPDTIREACLLQCQLAYNASKTSGQFPAGAQPGEYGMSMAGAGLHPYVRRMLDPFRDLGAR